MMGHRMKRPPAFSGECMPLSKKSGLERWESGLIHQFAKLAYPNGVPRVRIPLSPRLVDFNGLSLIEGVHALKW